MCSVMYIGNPWEKIDLAERQDSKRQDSKKDKQMGGEFMNKYGEDREDGENKKDWKDRITVEELHKIIRMAENDINSAPPGILYAIQKGNKYQYYCRLDGEPRVYLKRSEDDIARKLAQKEYAQKVYKMAKHDIRVWERADKLFRAGVPYIYEFPVNLNGIGYVRPDFYVLNIRTREDFYWEHLGMMDNPEYSGNAVRKIEMYEKNGIFPGRSLILTYETSDHPISNRTIDEIIDEYLK